MTQIFIIREEQDGLYRAYDSEWNSMYIGRKTLAETETALLTEIDPGDRIEYRVKHYAEHACGCGKTFRVPAGLPTYGKILRCPECVEARKELLTNIYNVMENVQVEELQISLSVRHLITLDDFDDSLELSFVRASRIAGSDYEVIGRWI